MPNNKKEAPVVYVKENRELMTRRDYFASAAVPVVGIRWEQEIKLGSNIVPGQLLAQIVWQDNDKSPIHAPSDCAGSIEWKNGRIRYEWLHKRSYALLCLV